MTRLARMAVRYGSRDYLAYNARIWQSSAELKDWSWMTFDTGTGYITDIGSTDPPVEHFPEGRRTDYKGRRIIPGLHESHIHVTFLGQLLMRADLQDCQSIEELQRRVRSFASEHPDVEWICGRGWEQDKLGRYPNRRDLDAVSTDRPIYLVRVCGHIGVVNSKALTVTGITKDTPDPQGGVIEHIEAGDPSSGQPTGLLFENAMDIVKPFVKDAADDTAACIHLALQTILRNGVTAVHACEDGTWPAFCRLADEGRLPMRVFYSAYFATRRTDNGSLPVAGETHGPWLLCDRVKLFVDGALGIATAALSRPYVDDASNNGLLLLSTEDLTSHIQVATAGGYRVEIHVIGDKAAEIALTALENAKVAAEKRPIFIHCQILRADLLNRMHERGVIASVQPQFVPTDARWLSERLQPELLEYAYPWKSLLDKGVVCAGGSDAPVEKPEPLTGIYDAIYRKVGADHQNNKLQFKPSECLSLRQAIDIYSLGGAYSAMQEDRLGRLLPGFQADFVVLEKDVCVSPEDLLTTKVLEVWVAGQRKL